MELREILVFIYSCCLCLRHASGQVEKAGDWDTDKYKEEAGQTYNLVFHKYNHRVRPPQAFIEITTSITLRHIRQLNIRKQELQTVLDLELTWIDSRLQWYPDRVHQIMANVSNVWSPDVVITNSVSSPESLYPSGVRITHKGNVSYTKKEMVTTLCRTELDAEIQNCAIQLGFMSNSLNDQTDRFFSNSSSFILPPDYVNHEWELEDAELDFDFGNVTRRVSTMEVQLWLRQQSSNGQQVVIGDDANSDKYTSYGTTSNNCADMEELRKNNGNGASPVSGSFCERAITLVAMVAVCLFAPVLSGLIVNR